MPWGLILHLPMAIWMFTGPTLLTPEQSDVSVFECVSAPASLFLALVSRRAPFCPLARSYLNSTINAPARIKKPHVALLLALWSLVCAVQASGAARLRPPARTTCARTQLAVYILSYFSCWGSVLARYTSSTHKLVSRAKLLKALEGKSRKVLPTPKRTENGWRCGLRRPPARPAALTSDACVCSDPLAVTFSMARQHVQLLSYRMEELPMYHDAFVKTESKQMMRAQGDITADGDGDARHAARAALSAASVVCRQCWRRFGGTAPAGLARLRHPRLRHAPGAAGVPGGPPHALDRPTQRMLAEDSQRQATQRSW
jgi:hypothetical protein